ncbi:MAG: LysR family transcriptional regulator [Hyphomicrobiales bacterium]|nr:LysR family transcriptional regulator [Hyphomicrobiales bacterium]
MSLAANQEMLAFVRVVERGSFAKAAGVLGLSPSAVSKLVGRLEAHLGVRLLHRTTRRLALTSEGEQYFDRARRILADMEEAELEVARLRAVPRGRLRVNTSSGFAVHQLAPAMPGFLARYPEVQVELSATDRVVDLDEEHADVTIRTGPVGDTPLAARAIAAYGRTICAAPAYLARHGTPRRPADLAQHTCITFFPAAGQGWPFAAGDGVAMTTLSRTIATDSSDTALRLALEGAGILRLGDIMVCDPIRAGLLVPLLADRHHPGTVEISALYLPGRRRLPAVRVFLDFLVEAFGHAPWRRLDRGVGAGL